jgi:hypothetical protein
MTRDRLLLIPLLLWGLVMVVPDLVRVVQPLGNERVIYDVTGPFPGEESRFAEG